MSNFGAILSAGTDAMSNLYDVFIDLPTILSNDPLLANDYAKMKGAYRVRIGDFTPPQLGINEVEVHYKTESFMVPGQIIEGERSFTINFRVNANFALYNLLLAWRNLYYNPSNGDVGRPIQATEFGEVKVVANKRISGKENYDDTLEDSANTVRWEFDYVWMDKLEGIEFSREDSTPITANATFMFGHMKFIDQDATLTP